MPQLPPIHQPTAAAVSGAQAGTGEVDAYKEKLKQIEQRQTERKRHWQAGARDASGAPQRMDEVPASLHPGRLPPIGAAPGASAAGAGAAPPPRAAAAAPGAPPPPLTCLHLLMTCGDAAAAPPAGAAAAAAPARRPLRPTDKRPSLAYAAPPPLPADMPYDAKAADATEYVPTTRAFVNDGFLGTGDHSRMIRVMCELEEPRHRLQREGIAGTILFFGSARSMYEADLDAEIRRARDAAAAAPDSPARRRMEAKIDRLGRCRWMTKYCSMCEDLARRVTRWLREPGVMAHEVIRPDTTDEWHVGYRPGRPAEYVVCTGGGPGLMEACNRGARSVPGARTMGMGISVPFEKGLNKFVSPELAFEFKYFFTRKWWMVFQAKALIACPGGLGTFDELFEILTLRQTGKIHSDIPVVLIGREFWTTVVDWQRMADLAVISQDDVDRMLITDDIGEAFSYLKRKLSGRGDAAAPAPPPPAPVRTLVVSGPSGVGKSTVINKLMETLPGRFRFSVSHTTRAPRGREQDGVDYNFVSQERFAELRQSGAMLESAEVHGNWYGTSCAAVEAVHHAGYCCVLDVDVQGAKQLRASGLDSLNVFLLPPSVNILEMRLRGRGTDAEDKILRRLGNAKAEMDFARENCPGVFDRMVPVHNPPSAVDALRDVLRV